MKITGGQSVLWYSSATNCAARSLDNERLIRVETKDILLINKCDSEVHGTKSRLQIGALIMVFCEVQIMVWFGPISIFPIPKNNQLPKIRTQNRLIWPISSQKIRVGFGFLGFD